MEGHQRMGVIKAHSCSKESSSGGAGLLGWSGRPILASHRNSSLILIAFTAAQRDDVLCLLLVCLRRAPIDRCGVFLSA